MDCNIDNLRDDLDSRDWDTIAIDTYAALGLNAMDAPTFRGYDTRRGSSRYSDRTFSMPRWIAGEPKAYAVAYCVHEVAHHIVGPGHNHDETYTAAEEQALAVWGIKPIMRQPRGNKYILSIATANGPVRPSDYPNTQYARGIVAANMAAERRQAMAALRRMSRAMNPDLPSKKDCGDCYHYPSGKVSHACAAHRISRW